MTPTITAEQMDAVIEFLDLDAGCWFDQATAFTCTETEALTGLLAAFGQESAAESILKSHAPGDEEDDLHYDPELTEASL